MSKTCSICLLLSPDELNPVFSYDGKTWNDTGLSKMLELNSKAKIIKDNKSKLFICNYCLKKTIEIYFNTDNQKDNINITINKSKKPSSNQEKDEYKRKKIKLSKNDDDNILRFAVPVKKKDEINSLNKDCLAEIFSYLPVPQIVQMEKVCQKWRDASSFAWYKIKEFNQRKCNENLKQKDVEEILLRCGQYLTNLILDKRCESSILSVIKKNCLNLTTITLFFKYTRASDFVGVFSEMTKLKSINFFIDSCSEDEYPTSVNHARILDNLPETVEEIDFQGPFMKLFSTALILNNFSSLALERFNSLSHLSMSNYTIDDCAVLSHLKSLVSLNFFNCQFTPRGILTSNLPNLKELSFQISQYIDEFFISSAIECRNLKELTIYDSDFTSTSSTFREIGKFTNLEILNLDELNNLDDTGILRIIKRCQKLKKLRLDSCSNLYPDSLSQLGNLSQLEDLNLAYTNADGNVISSITQKCQQLKILNLMECKNIPSTALRKLKNLKNLEDLDLSQIENIDDSVIISLSKNCKKLKILFICPDEPIDVSDHSVQKLIKNCRFLETLQIFNTKMTLDTLIFAARHKNICHHNNVVLEINTHLNLLESFNKLKITSPYFKVY